MSCISFVFCRNNIVKNTDKNLVDRRKNTIFFLQVAAVHRLGFPSKSKHERLVFRWQFAQGCGAFNLYNQFAGHPTSFCTTSCYNESLQYIS